MLSLAVTVGRIPAIAGWPDATNTGLAGVGMTVGDLTPMTGSTINTPGTIIEARDVTDPIIPNAANITIRRCRLNAGFFGVDAFTDNAPGLLIEDCDVVGGDNCGIAITGAGSATVQRCNIYGGRDGLKVGGPSKIVQDTYIHDLDTSGVDPHNDGIQVHGGSGMLFRHNWIESPDTSCIALFEGQGTWNDVLIDDNYFTGAGYLLYCGGVDGTNIRVFNNTFGDWIYGPVTDWNAAGVGNQWSGNVRAGTGAPVNP